MRWTPLFDERSPPRSAPVESAITIACYLIAGPLLLWLKVWDWFVPQRITYAETNANTITFVSSAPEHQWRPWFAWYPIDAYGISVWLETIERRTSVYKDVWEYRLPEI